MRQRGKYSRYMCLEHSYYKPSQPLVGLCIATARGCKELKTDASFILPLRIFIEI